MNLFHWLNRFISEAHAKIDAARNREKIELHSHNALPRRGIPYIMLALLLVSASLSACSNHFTVLGVTFGKRTPPPVVTVANLHPTPLRQTKASQNWSGYSLAFGRFTSVTASWQVPQVSDPADSDSSTWIGIGGINSDTLIQAGTDQLVQKGKPYYYAWIETLPQPPQPVKSIEVLPGDMVSFSIINTGGTQWQVTVNDLSGGQKTTKNVVYDSCACSSEWIEEAPSVNGQQSPLAHFTSVTFTDCALTVNGQALKLSGTRPQAIRMVNASGSTVMQPQILAGDGFSVVDIDQG